LFSEYFVYLNHISVINLSFQTAFPLMLKINSFNFGYRFIVYDRVVAVRCGTLLQPMLVIDLSASNSIGRAGVVLPKLHYYFIKLALHQCSLPLIC
jgi:hypothetical protein